MRRIPLLLALALLTAVAACGPKTPTDGASPRPSVKKVTTASPTVNPNAGAHVRGILYAPKDTQAGSYQLLLRADRPVANAPVALVPTSGGAAVPKGTTNPSGQYDIGGLGVDQVVHVRASIKTTDGKAAFYDTLAKADQSLSSDIDIASTMVALTVIAHARGGNITYDAIAFAKAVAAVQGELDSAPMPDATQPDALIAQTEALAKQIADLNAVVGGPLGGGTPSPDGSGTGAATPTPGATASTPGSTPTPVPTATPSPLAVATATPGVAKSFAAALNAAGEVPASNASGSGSATVTLPADRSAINLNGIATGLTGPITGVDLLEGPPGDGAKVLRTIPVNGTSLTMVWAVTDAVPLTIEAINALEAGKLYVNILTAAHPKGEIIGQIK